MLKLKNYIYTITTLLVALSVSNSTLAADTYSGEWNKVSATLNVTTENINDLQRSDGTTTLFDTLLDKESKKPSDVTEADGKSVKIFSIAYKAIIKLQNDAVAKEQVVTQYGLFKTLDPVIVAQIQRNPLPQSVNIGYLKSDPILIKFDVDGKVVSLPALITKAVDDRWVPISK